MIYLTFVLKLLLEYASALCKGCSSAKIKKLEKVQLHAPRIVTGLPMLASDESLHIETGWESLDKRWKNAKLTIMYKIHYTIS